jgi:hypothetical protein
MVHDWFIQIAVRVTKQTQKRLQLSTVRGARQDKRSFLTSFFMLNPSKTLLALNKTCMGVVNSQVATFPFEHVYSLISLVGTHLIN